MNDFAFGRLVTLNVVKLLLENSDRNIDLNTSNTLVSLVNVHMHAHVPKANFHYARAY